MTDTVGPVEALVAKVIDPPSSFTSDDAEAEAHKIDAQMAALTEALEASQCTCRWWPDGKSVAVMCKRCEALRSVNEIPYVRLNIVEGEEA